MGSRAKPRITLGDRLKKAAKSSKDLPPFVARPELLLTPTIPCPLHEVNPRTILGAKWWNETRKAAYAKTSYRCAACGTPKSQTSKGYLEAHEVYKIDYLGGTATYVESVALCTRCHESIHLGRLQAMLEKGEITQSHFVAVIQHGDKVLAEAGLKRPEPYAGPFQVWGKWRLVLNRRKYKPKYESEKSWNRKFGV